MVIPPAGEQDLRGKKGFFPIKMRVLSLVNRLALKQGLSPPTPRSRGLWGCYCSRQDTQPEFPRGFPRKAASLGLQWGGQQCHHSVPSQGGQGGAGKERSWASPKGWDGPLLPQPNPTVLKGAGGLSQKLPLKMHLSPRRPHPHQIQPNTPGRSQPSGMLSS